MSLLRWLRDALLGEDPPPAPDEIVVLTETAGEGVAGLYRGILEQNGIHCIVQNVSGGPYMTIGQSWEVRVQFKDIARATEILGLDVEPSG
jgi:hypothetical protein